MSLHAIEVVKVNHQKNIYKYSVISDRESPMFGPMTGKPAKECRFEYGRHIKHGKYTRNGDIQCLMKPLNTTSI